MMLRFLAALTVPLVFLVSCTDDPEPILAPSASPTPTSEEPSPTEVVSVEPESPEEFIRRWVVLSNEMQSSGGTEAYLQVSRRCAPCKGVARDVTDIYAAGGSIETEGWDVLEFINNAGPPKQPIIDVHIRSAPVKVIRTEGSEPEELPGGRLVERFELQLDGSEWSIRNLSQVAS